MAHKGAADWLHQPYRLGGPQRLRAGDKISSGEFFLAEIAFFFKQSITRFPPLFFAVGRVS